MDWSYDLLSEDEQAFLRRLAVFAGGFTLESAQQVAVDGGGGGDAALDLVEGLIDKCLLVAEMDRGKARYRLQTIREFAYDRLAHSGEAERVRRGHAVHFCALAEEAEPALTGAEQVSWLNRLEQEHENLREALACCLAGEETGIGIRMAAALWRFWYIRGYFSEGRQWLDALLKAGEPAHDAARARALRAAAVMARVQGDYEQAHNTQEEALAIFRELGDRPGIAMTLNSLGILTCGTGEFERARDILGGECLSLYRELGDRRGIATCTNNLSIVARAAGDFPAMQELCRASLEMYREVGFQEGVAASLMSLGFAAMFLENYSEAPPYVMESLAIYRELGYREGVAEALEALASLAALQALDRRAARLFGASEALRELVAAPLPFPHEKRERDKLVTALRGRMSPGAARNEWLIGRSLSMDDALAYAMDDVTRPARGVALPGGLTRREVEIAALVAQGLKDKDIAERLSISPRTAGKHVEHIRDKLELRTRSELGAWATRVGLLN